MKSSHRLLLLPVAIFFMAFWLLPVSRLLILPAEQDWRLYFVFLTEARYAWSLITLPLSFPGVIIGFFMILLAGRQGLVTDITQALGLGRFSFAYGLAGLFLAYLYFSLPRAIAAYAAAAQSMDKSVEEAARSLGARRWHIIRDVWMVQLESTTSACAAIVFATAMGAFGTAFTLSSQFEVLPITIYSEFTNFANFTLAASLSITLGLFTWFALFLTRRKETVAGVASQ